MRKVFDLSNIVGFEWDEGNREKNWNKNKVDYKEAEEIFFNKPLRISEDTKHSSNEKRFHALGITNNGRKLFMAFTIRRNKTRPISCRNQDDKERRDYEK